MVLDPIPQSLPVHFFGSRPQPPTSPHDATYCTHTTEISLKKFHLRFMQGISVEKFLKRQLNAPMTLQGGEDPQDASSL